MTGPLRYLPAIALFAAALAAVLWLMQVDSPAPIVIHDRHAEVTEAARAPNAAPRRVEARVAPSTAPARGTVTGRILDPDLSPVANLSVQLVSIPESTLEPSIAWLFDVDEHRLWTVHEPTVTDAHGRYVLPAGPSGYRTLLRIDPRGRRAALFSDLPHAGANDGRTDHGEFVLPKRRTFTGRVVDETGRAVPSAVVRLIPEFRFPWNAALSDLPDLHWIVSSEPYTVVPAPPILRTSLDLIPTLTVRTDGDGRFRLFAAPGDRGTVVFDHQYFARSIVPIEVESSAVVRNLGEVTMRTPRRVEGSIVTRRARPIEGVEVGAGFLESDGTGYVYRFARTDRHGRFAIDGLFERDHVFFYRNSGDHEWVAAGPYSIRRDLRFVLEPRRALDVTVTDNRNARVADAEVALQPDVDRSEFEAALAPLPARAAPDGFTRFEGVEARESFVYARADGYVPAYGIALEGMDAITIQMSAARSLPVRCIDADTSLPVPFAEVRAREAGAASVHETGSLLAEEVVTTDLDGSATFTCLGDLPYRLVATHDDHAPLERTSPPNANGALLPFTRGGCVTGRLTIEGRPLANRRVVLLEHDDERYGIPRRTIALTTGDGSFSFANVAEGYYRLDLRVATRYVTAGDQPFGALLDSVPDASIELAVARGETVRCNRDLASLVSAVRRPVRGAVRFNGELLAHRLVQAWVHGPDTGWTAAETTDADGSFFLGFTDSPWVRVTIDALDESNVHRLDGSPLQIDLDGAWLVGTIRRGADRAPSPGVHVAIERERRTDGEERLRHETFSDAAGAFRFPLLPTGRYRLVAKGAAGEELEELVTIEPVGEAMEPVHLTLGG